PRRSDEEPRVVADRPLLRRDPVRPVAHVIGREREVSLREEPPECRAVLARARALDAQVLERGRAQRTRVRTVGHKHPRLLEQLAEGRPPESDRPLRWLHVGKLLRRLAPSEPPASRLDARSRVGGFEPPAGEGEGAWREAALWMSLEEEHL